MKLWEPKRKCPKVVPRHLQNHVVWSRTLKCSVKPHMTGPSTRCYFNELLFMQVLTHDKNRINQRLWTFGVPWSPGFVLGLSPRGGFWKNPSDHETWSIRCHVGVQVDFTSILHSHTPSVGPSSVVWSELGPVPPFPQMRVLEVWWSRALNLMCEVARRPLDLQLRSLKTRSHFVGRSGGKLGLGIVIREILVFVSPTGYMLTSSGFPLLNWDVFYEIPLEWSVILSGSLELQPVISQTQPVHL